MVEAIASEELMISIHTSAREVTKKKGGILKITAISIHTSAREVTLLAAELVIAPVFQSTLPQGK